MTSSLIALILLSFCLGCGCWLFFLWAVHRGEFSDMERPKHRMLDDDAPLPREKVRGEDFPPSSIGSRDTASTPARQERQARHKKSH